MTSQTEIKNYIDNYFHPYYDINLKPNSIPLTEPINCIIPTEIERPENTYFTHNKEESTETKTEILDKYDDTLLEKEYEVLCTNVVDGDTIDVKIIKKLSTNITYTEETARVRLVGVNTPEISNQGGSVSKKFVEKLCKNQTLYLNIDNKNPIDKYNRILAVVIVGDKNLNQILLKEGLGEIMFIPPSEFNPFDWDSTAYISNMNIQSVNFSQVLPYLNNESNNLAFTNQDDNNVFHQFEVYKGIIYLKLYPYNSKIRLHILPKSYKGDSNLLIFKDEFVTNENITKANCSSKLFPPINATATKNNSSYELNYDISKATQGFNTLQINAGYQYPSSVTKVFHLTGIKDETNEKIADRCTLLDANYDTYTTYSNDITQFLLDSENIVSPTTSNLNIKKSSSEMNINHINTINEIFHKTIKYMNDDIYIEEKRKHLQHNWGE